MAWPDRLVPPPRDVIGTRMAPAILHGGDDVVGRTRDDDAERFDLVDAGVGGVELARRGVEAHLSGDVVAQVPGEVVALLIEEGVHETSPWPGRSIPMTVYSQDRQSLAVCRCCPANASRIRRGDWRSFQTMASSRPPLTMTRTFMPPPERKNAARPRPTRGVAGGLGCGVEGRTPRGWMAARRPSPSQVCGRFSLPADPEWR